MSSSISLTFCGNHVTVMCLTVSIIDDGKLEGVESFSVIASSSDASVTIDDDTAVIDIVDGDGMSTYNIIILK